MVKCYTRTGSVSGKQYTTCNKDIADNKSTNKKSTNKQMPKKAPSFSKPSSTSRIDTSAPRKVGLESAFLKRQMTSGISGGGLDTALSKRGMISQPPAIRIDTSAPRKVGLESTFLNRQMKSQKEVIHPIIKSFDEGLNVIDYDKIRWSCCACIYYPTPQSAQNILEYIYKKKSYRTFDLFLSESKLISYLYYPSPFKIDDKNVSQYHKPNGLIDNYM